MILLVVDTQKAITNDKLYQFDLFKSRVIELIRTARNNKIEVIFVRHDDGIGNELTKEMMVLKYMMDFNHLMVNLFLTRT